jgi:hypothetical protein
MGKVKNTVTLTATEIAFAKKMGLSPQDYAKAVQQINMPVTMTTFNPNKDPVYSIPLSELINLWRVRYGDTWVDVSEIEEEFWEAASSRLHQNHMMETINHHSDTTPWSRLKEDA